MQLALDSVYALSQNKTKNYHTLSFLSMLVRCIVITILLLLLFVWCGVVLLALFLFYSQ